jgi:hypothetical protein
MRQNGIAGVGSMALRIIQDCSILLAFFFPFRPRAANTPDGKPAPDDLDVLAHSFIRICGHPIRPGFRFRLDRDRLHSQQQAANGRYAR